MTLDKSFEVDTSVPPTEAGYCPQLRRINSNGRLIRYFCLLTVKELDGTGLTLALRERYALIGHKCLVSRCMGGPYCRGAEEE